MCNIAAGYDSSRTLRKKTYNLLPDSVKNGDFDIIKGEVSQCNLAAIGIAEIMSILDKGRIKRENLKREMEEKLKDLWEI